MFIQLFASTADNVVAGTNVALVVLGIIGVIGIIGAVSAYFYKGRADALIDLQEKQIKVLQDNKTTLEEQNEKLIEERKEFLAEQKRMRQEIKTLRSLITQPKQFNSLAQTLAKQHADVMTKLTNIAEGLVNSKEQ